MLRIGKMTDYALVIMHCMAKSPSALLRMEDIAQGTQLPLATVRKLMRQLVNGGLVRSERGARGGYQLARFPELISIAHIVRAVEGPLAITECCDDDGGCELQGDCGVESQMPTLNELIGQIFASITLTDMAHLCGSVQGNVGALISRLHERLALVPG